MSERRRLKAGYEFEVTQVGSGTPPLYSAVIVEGDTVNFYRSELDAISEVVPAPPPPSARERLVARIQSICLPFYGPREVADAILADLGLDENGKRAMPDEDIPGIAKAASNKWHRMNPLMDADAAWREITRAVLLASGAFAEPGK